MRASTIESTWARDVSGDYIMVDSKREDHAVRGTPRSVVPTPLRLWCRRVPVDRRTLGNVDALRLAGGQRRRRHARLCSPHRRVRVFRPRRQARIFQQVQTLTITSASLQVVQGSRPTNGSQRQRMNARPTIKADRPLTRYTLNAP